MNQNVRMILWTQDSAYKQASYESFHLIDFHDHHASQQAQLEGVFSPKKMHRHYVVIYIQRERENSNVTTILESFKFFSPKTRSYIMTIRGLILGNPNLSSMKFGFYLLPLIVFHCKLRLAMWVALAKQRVEWVSPQRFLLFRHG